VSSKSPRRIIVQPYDFSVQDLVDKISANDIDLKPDYQRNYVWGSDDGVENKRCRLIESLLLNIPIPVIYFAEQAETLKYEVIDGQQRLKTFQDFLGDGFALHNLEIRDDVNGKTYSQLDQRDRDEIRKRSIRAIVVLNESDEEIKYEVFERLNLGSVQLTPQEIRNNSFRGTFNDLLKELAESQPFKSMFKARLKSDKSNMAYEELVLRFFAYHFSGSKRVEQLTYFLTKFMKENRNQPSETINEYRRLFAQTINKIQEYLGEDAFSMYIPKTKTWNSTSNRLVYESQMLAFSSIQESEIIVSPEIFKQRLKTKMENSEFQKMFDAAGGRKIQERLDEIKDMLTQPE
jgi:uncharacterized protein with ParB-like and HNH nuclease domain